MKVLYFSPDEIALKPETDFERDYLTSLETRGETSPKGTELALQGCNDGEQFIILIRYQ